MPQQYERAKQIFLEVCDLPKDQRRAALDRECGGDREMRHEVETLLAHHTRMTIIRYPSSSPQVGDQPVLRKRGVFRTAGRLLDELFARPILRWMTILLILVMLSALGFWMHRGIRASLRQMLAEQLQTILNADIIALEQWIKDKQGDAQAWARQPDVRHTIELLIAASQSSKSSSEDLVEHEAQSRLRELVGASMGTGDRVQFVVVDASGLVLATLYDQDVGTQLSAKSAPLLQRVFAGDTLVTEPFPEGFYGVDRPIHYDVPMVWSCAPVVGKDDKVIGMLAFGMLADGEYSDILSVARIGKTGETYAFDKQGWMLSESRFEDQLRDVGLIPKTGEARSIFKVQIRDPGGNLIKGYRPASPLNARPLTKMAAMATAQIDGYDVEGYRDYRGVLVIGAWRWLPKLGYGVATQVDYDEGYALLDYPYTAFWIRFGLLSAAICGLFGVAAWASLLNRELGEIKRLGQYTLEEKIGEGGIGVVYKARHAFLRRPTAVKLLRSDRMTDSMVERFKREVQLASQLTHPNTIEIYDYGESTDGVFYYVMEYLPGFSLAELIARGEAIPLGRTLHILRQMCASLREAHDRGLLHRDIKPANVMLCERGGMLDVVKVLDFGLVKEYKNPQHPELTATGQVSGTIRYMAPERFDEAYQPDVRSDIYSVGAVAYNLLTGRPVFESRNTLDYIRQIIETVPVPPGEHFQGELPVEIDRLVMSCLDRNPENRPANITAVLEIIEHTHRDHPWTQADARRSAGV